MKEKEILPKVSIIVPVYNCGRGHIIENLVNDILNQTEQSWELLLCNDGSSDNTLDICRRLALCDSRIITIDNPHQGVSATRNSGIDNAQGEWITFVDADDHLTGCFIEGMLLAATRNEIADMVCGSYMILHNKLSEACLYSDSYYSNVDEVGRLIESTDFLKRCSPWAKLFRREIIEVHNIRFNQRLSHSEDRLFVYEYLQYVNAIATSSVVGYIYESFSSDSLKHKVHPFEMLVLRQKVLTESAFKVMKTFKVDDKGCFHFVNNLLNILLDGAQSLNIQFGMRKAKELQVKLIESSAAINGLIKSNKKIRERINNDILLSSLLRGELNKFNRIQDRSQRILKIKQTLRYVLRKKRTKCVYDNYIHKINF